MNGLFRRGCSGLKDKPLIHVMFAFQIGSKADSEILYRFDAGPMQLVEPRILRELKIFVIETKTEVKQFLDGLATANALYIQISSLDKGSTSAEFRVAGAQRRIDVPPPIASPRPRRCERGRSALLCLGKIAIAVLNRRA